MVGGFIFIWEEKLEFDVAASDAGVPEAEAGEVWHQDALVPAALPGHII